MSEKTTRWTPEELVSIRQTQARAVPPPAPKPEWPWQNHHCPMYEYCADCVDQAADETAAVAFGLMGMAHAIRARLVYEHHCSTCARLGDLCRFCCYGG